MKFHLNEDIEWHCMQLKLNSNTLNQIHIPLNQIEIQLNSIQFQSKRNKMQIGAKCIENMLITSIICDYDFWKDIHLKRHLSISFRALKAILVGQDD
jgi:hypothetical protein